VTLLVLPWPITGIPDYRVGQVAQVEVRAPGNIEVVDKKATRLLLERAREKVKPVFDLDTRWISQTSDKIATLFSELRVSFEESDVKRDLGQFKKMLGVDLPENVVRTFRRYKYTPWVEDAVTSLLFKLGEYWILPPGVSMDPQALVGGFVVRDVQLSKEFISHRVERIYSLSEVGVLIRRLVVEKLPYRMGALRRAVIILLSHLAKPDFFYNQKVTQERLRQAQGKVKPVVIKVRKGEVIIGKGKKVTPKVALLLESAQGVAKSNFLLPALGHFWGILLLLYISTLCWFRVYKGRAESYVSYRLFLSVLVGFMVIVRFFLMISHRMPLLFSWVGDANTMQAVPWAFPGVFIAFLFHFLPSLVLLMALTGCMAFLSGLDPLLLVTFLAVSTVGAYAIRKGKGEKAVVIGIGMSLLVSIILEGAFLLIRGYPWGFSSLLGGVALLISALLSLFLVLAAVPLTELIFGVVTDIKLLSFINLDHPLMLELLEKAPGTYNHSVDVATLAEAAAKAVDANPVLAKAGAYYHDIGKLKNPEYFIENMEGVNRHDKLAPSMSRLVIISHVKDGVELARKYKLPKAIRDIIQQHHGTSLIYYFYRKAKDGSKNGDVEEEDYRYPGPKPRTKEAAIVMIADAVEAAARSLEEPSPSRIRHLVREIVTNIFLDGQLEECDLTLRDIYKIMDVFSRILTAIHHKRIEYPEREEKSGGLHTGPAKDKTS